MKIIADVGSERFEAGTPGLCYTLISRATTIGELTGNQLDSALYFFGSNMSEQRITSLSKRIDGTTTKAAQKRELWVAYLMHRVQSCVDKVKHYCKETIIARTKMTLKSHEQLDIEEVIEGYVQLLEKTDKKTKEKEHSYSEWIEEHKKNNDTDIKELTCDKTIKEELHDDNRKCNTDTDDVSDSDSDDFSLECVINNSDAYDHYAEEPISTEGIYGVPDIIKHYAYDIRDVEGNGNCGWYAIQEGLLDNGIPFKDEMNKFRNSIYDYFIKSRVEDIFVNPVVIKKRNIMRRIWNSTTNFNTGCEEGHWFESGQIMPIITQMFKVNCVCYSVHDTKPITIATFKRNNESVCVQERNFINPAEICHSSMYRETIGLIYLPDKRHYMYAKLRI